MVAEENGRLGSGDGFMLSEIKEKLVLSVNSQWLIEATYPGSCIEVAPCVLFIMEAASLEGGDADILLRLASKRNRRWTYRTARK